MKSTKVKNKMLIVISCVVAIIAVLMASNLLLLQTAYAAGAEDNISHLTEDKYDFTNTDDPNGISILQYESNYYGKNASLSWGSEKTITVSGSDDIIKIIPEELFKTEGVTQHIGKQYGFFIETRKPLAYCDMLMSTVVIVDIKNTDNMYSPDSVSHLKIEIKPIFQADFAYVKRGDKKTFSLDEQDYNLFKEKYFCDLNVLYPAVGDEFIVPVPTLIFEKTLPKLRFLQHNKYYLTDMSNQTSLYNVNQLNPGDNGYDPRQDMGCFFSQLDFAYDGGFFETGKTTFSDVGSVAYNATSLAFDVYDAIVGLKSVFKAVPVVGMVISTADIIASMAEINENLKTKLVSESKTLSYEPMYNNKDQQIASSGGLRKDAAIAIQSEGNKQLLFGTNDKATFDYQINCQDIAVDTRYATMINFGVVSVTNITSGFTEYGEIHRATGVYSNELKNNPDDMYKEIPALEIGGLKTESSINILPNCQGLMELKPKLTGQYDINIDNPYAGFSIYEVSRMSNGVLNFMELSNSIGSSSQIGGSARANEVYLDKNKNYLLIADLKANAAKDQIHGRYGIVKISAELNKKELVIGENNCAVDINQEYFKINSEHNVNYRFVTNNEGGVLRLLNDDFGVIASSSNGALTAVFEEGRTYYIRLDRTQSTAENISIYVRYEMYVRFDNIQGIDAPIDEMLTVANDEAVKLPNPQKIGYVFDGWRTSLDNLGELVTNDNIFDFVRPELTLIAKWTPIEYTIFYVENGGEEIADGHYIIEHDVVLNCNIARAGYVFCGWYDNPSFNGKEITGFSAGNVGNKTFYARWVKDTFNVAMDVNAGYTDGVGAALSASSKNVGFRQYFTLPVPVLGGFVFEGWYNGDLKVTDNAGNSYGAYEYESDITLTAKWAREKYFIKINKDNTYYWLTRDGEDFSFSTDKTYVENEIGLCPNCYIRSMIAKGGPLAEQIKAYLFKEGNRYQYMIKDKSDPSSLACWQGAELGAEFNDNETIEIFAYHTPEEQFKIYIENGKGGYLDSIYADYGQPIVYKVTPKEDGKTFSHYIVSKTETRNQVYNGTHFAPGSIFNESTMPDLSIGVERDGDAIYLAPVFTANKYTITLYNDGRVYSTKTVIYGEPYNTSNGNAFPAIAKTGNYFMGWYTEAGTQKTDAQGNIVNSKLDNNRWDIASNCSLYSRWDPKQYRVSLDTQGGADGASLVIATYGKDMPTADAPTMTGYEFLGYFTEQNGKGTKYYDGSMKSVNKWNIDEHRTLYAYWRIIHYTITYENLSGHWGDFVTVNIPNPTENPSTYTVHDRVVFKNPTLEGLDLWWDTSEIPMGSTGNKTISLQWREHKYYINLKADGIKADEGRLHVLYSDKVTIKYNNSTKATFSHWTLNGGHYSNSEEITVWKLTSVDGGEVTLIAHYNSECVAEGTLITLADGSQKPVEELTGDEELLVWNLMTGTFDTAPILFIDHDAAREYEVINLGFSDGTTVEVISEHGFWDFNLNEYVFLRSDAARYIGHWFNKQITDSDGKLSWTKVRLESVEITKNVTTAWSPVTYGHLCYYVNGMLSMPGATTGLINIFDVNPETMKIDEAAYAADIAEYGLFAYEEFAAMYPVPEVIFEAFGGQYLKVAMGKGLLTEDMLINLIERYSVFFK